MPYPAKTNPEEVLKVALELLEQDAASLSMRNLAERLNMKAPSLYRHFPDKETLELAMMNEGAKAMKQELEKVSRGLKANQAIQEVAKAYLKFAKQHPALYSLMMTRLNAPNGAGKELWNFVLELMSQVTRHKNDTPAAVAFWSFLHGFSVLEMSGMFGASGPRGGLEAGLEAFLNGLPKRK
jgi:AcrR family transcriptional regulator